MENWYSCVTGLRTAYFYSICFSFLELCWESEDLFEVADQGHKTALFRAGGLPSIPGHYLFLNKYASGCNYFYTSKTRKYSSKQKKSSRNFDSSILLQSILKQCIQYTSQPTISEKNCLQPLKLASLPYSCLCVRIVFSFSSK